MTKRAARDPIYRGRRFSAETIELCVRWYITYRLSYRDLAAMLAERGIVGSHTTIMRWVLRYVPEYEARWARFARSPRFVVAYGRNSGKRSWRPTLSLHAADADKSRCEERFLRLLSRSIALQRNFSTASLTV